MISAELQTRLENNIGVAIDQPTFDRAEQCARRKLDWINERAGRQYGEDGYGDDYLVVLTQDVLYEQAFADFTMALYMERLEVTGDEANVTGAS